MKRNFTFSVVLFLGACFLFETALAQIKMGDGAAVPNASSVLDLQSTNKGFLPPRMTTVQRNSIASPANGMVIFNTTLNCLQVYKSTGWECLSSALNNFPPRLTYDEIIALPFPKEGDLAYDKTYDCLRTYLRSGWVCSNKDASESLVEATAWTINGTGVERIQDVVTDPLGNIYATGFFSGTVIIGDTSFTSPGASSMFLVKYSKSGNRLWVRIAVNAVSPAVGSRGNAIALDNAGNVYVTGTFTNTVTFGTITVSSPLSYNFFIVKYSDNGTAQWVRKAESASNMEGLDITTDQTNNVYLTGSFSEDFVLKKPFSSAGGNDIFIAKYNSTGDLEWIDAAGDIGNDYGFGIATDEDNNVYICGRFSNTLKIGMLSIISSGLNDIFLAKLNTNGGILWLKKAGGTVNEAAYDLAIDSNGDILMTGFILGTTSFDTIAVPASTGFDVFIAKYNNLGNALWVIKNTDPGGQTASSVALDSQDNIYLSGYFEGSITFGNISLNDTGDRHAFVAKFNPAGICQWVKKLSGPGSSEGTCIAVHASDVFSGGTYSGITNTDGRLLPFDGSASDAFLIRVHQ
ncbi:NHL repeat-containing protein [Arundinibacter roseus]|uniref:Beta-propeller repeat protein n=1 Tax=Arundinibacter roseus TaxID=2070510 RepID=A0A4R4JWV6_9BACT|nr:hypothetical protein [Arundinibacter roseus]TDB59143.1 hypothetical protein EZE20_22705 [Arundinibacter roseus]